MRRPAPRSRDIDDLLRIAFDRATAARLPEREAIPDFATRTALLDRGPAEAIGRPLDPYEAERLAMEGRVGPERGGVATMSLSIIARRRRGCPILV